MKTKKYLFINNLTLKIIGTILMTLSHIGLFLSLFYDDSSDHTIFIISNLFTYIGSLAFPIFLFLILEGINKTSNIKKYLLRIVIMALIIAVAIPIISIVASSLASFSLDIISLITKFGNIFIDLSLYIVISILIKNIKDKNKYDFISILALIIIFIFYLVTYLMKIEVIEVNSSLYLYVGALMPQYSIFGLILFLVSKLAFYLYEKKVNALDPNFKETNASRFYLSKNIIYCILLVIFSILSYIFTYIGNYLGVDNVVSTYILLASIFIVFYNYKLGYKSKIIKYSFYVYYPLHIVLIYLIFILMI